MRASHIARGEVPDSTIFTKPYAPAKSTPAPKKPSEKSPAFGFSSSHRGPRRPPRASARRATAIVGPPARSQKLVSPAREVSKAKYDVDATTATIVPSVSD